MVKDKRTSRAVGLIIGVVIVGVAIVSIFLIDWKTEPVAEPPPVRPLKTMTIGSSVTRGVYRYPGRVQAARRVDLAFRISGPLVDLPVTEGQNIEEGDLIARIDPRDFRIALESIQSGLDESLAGLEAMRRGRPEDIVKLRAEVQKAEAAVALATSEYERAREAHQRNALTDLELARKLEAKDTAGANLQQAREDLKIGETGARPEDIDAAEARVRGLTAQRDDAQAALDDTELRAPFCGRIASRFVDNFENVQMRQPIVSLQNISAVEIVINIPEIDVVHAARERAGGGYAAFVTFESLPDRRFDATLKEFSTEADPATQTFTATLTMPAPDPKDVAILPGMTATVTVYPENPQATGDLGFVLPLDAVPVDGNGQYYVWVVRESGDGALTVHRTDVTPGDLAGDDIMILDGISSGDEIATAGVHLLQEGQQVRRYDQPAEGGAS